MSLLRNRDNHNKSWSLKDFLFRSTSEGRGTSKAAKLAKGRSPDEACGSGRGRRGRTMSAHELHYRENRMVSEEMRRRTTLPFKPGFFACLGHGGARNVGHVSRPGSASFFSRSNRR
ncbi:hypothetical protein MLD38_023047 [Melastoma candidum]|nr:hypothetical protein MLD38_023047 [Melastoma candidum]